MDWGSGWDTGKWENGRWVLREIPNPRGGLQSGSIEFLTGLRAFGSALLPDVGLAVV